MLAKRDLGVESAEFQSLIEDLDLGYSAKLVKHASMIYIALHGSDVEFYGLRPGDRVLIKITKVKRQRGRGIVD